MKKIAIAVSLTIGAVYSTLTAAFAGEDGIDGVRNFLIIQNSLFGITGVILAIAIAMKMRFSNFRDEGLLTIAGFCFAASIMSGIEALNDGGGIKLHSVLAGLGAASLALCALPLVMVLLWGVSILICSFDRSGEVVPAVAHAPVQVEGDTSPA